MVFRLVGRTRRRGPIARLIDRERRSTHGSITVSVEIIAKPRRSAVSVLVPKSHDVVADEDVADQALRLLSTADNRTE